MYTLTNYATMIRDAVRIAAYQQALQRVIKPTSFVIDLGAGTGVMSFLAAQLGAHHVYAIETNPCIRLGRLIADANGLGNKISFLEGSFEKAQLQQKADILVADIRGQLPLFHDSLVVMKKAREQLLKPDGVLMPQRDLLLGALITAEEYYAQMILDPWAINTLNVNMK
ncbi:MAG: hypothetical protein CUN55_17015, partial [Phototrophicales bacterium]